MHGFTVCILVIAATLQVLRGQLEQKVARIDDFLQSVARTRNMRNPKVWPGSQMQKLESRYAKKPNRQSEKDMLDNGEYSTVVMAAQRIGGQVGTYSNADEVNDEVPYEVTTKDADSPLPKAEKKKKEPPQFSPPVSASHPAPVMERGMVALYQNSNNYSGPANPRDNDNTLLPGIAPFWPSLHFSPGFPPSWAMPEQRIIRIPHPIPVPHPVPVIVHKFIPYPIAHPVPFPMSLR